jgi:hypothetical protein
MSGRMPGSFLLGGSARTVNRWRGINSDGIEKGRWCDSVVLSRCDGKIKVMEKDNSEKKKKSKQLKLDQNFSNVHPLMY